MKHVKLLLFIIMYNCSSLLDATQKKTHKIAAAQDASNKRQKTIAAEQNNPSMEDIDENFNDAEEEQGHYQNTYEGLLDAAIAGNVREIRRLVEKEKIPVDLTDRDRLNPSKYGSPLRMAAQEGHVAAITELVERLGANITARGVRGLNALDVASSLQRIDAIKELVRLGADINAQDATGKTALMYAIMNNDNLKVVEELLRLNANIHIRDKADKTALIYAGEFKRSPEIIITLLKAGAQPEKWFWRAVRRDELIMDAIRKYNSSIIPPDRAFWTQARQYPAVMKAIQRQDEENQIAIQKEVEKALPDEGSLDLSELVAEYAIEPVMTKKERKLLTNQHEKEEESDVESESDSSDEESVYVTFPFRSF